MESNESNQPKDRHSKRKALQLKPDAHEKAVRLSQKYGLPMNALTATLYDLCEEYDLLKPGWAERLNEAMKVGEGQIQKKKAEAHEDRCPQMKYANERWNCVKEHGSKLKITKLAKEFIDARELCSGCPEPKRKRDRDAFYARTRRSKPT